jgi:hypothetical protein
MIYGILISWPVIVQAKEYLEILEGKGDKASS